MLVSGSLQNIMANPQTGVRRSKRHPIRMAVVLLMAPHDTRTQCEGFTVDISQHGCRIEGSASLGQGQIIQLTPQDAPETPIMGRVIWVGEPASDLAGEAGIEFLQPLSTVA